MVRRFDEVLTLKASKQRLDDEIVKFNKTLDEKFEDYLKLIEKLNEELKKQHTKFQEFTCLVKDNIYEAVQKVSKRQNDVK